MSKKKETIKDLSRLPRKELEHLQAEKKEKLRQLRFDLVGGKIKNIREIRATKREIAQILTLLNKQ